jgi:hypothetical protein
MASLTLEEFIGVNRDELISRCRAKVSKRSPPMPAKADDDHGVPRLLDQVVEELRHGPSTIDEITRSATAHGHNLLLEGFTIGQVVHGYGDVCQSVTELAVELAAPISAGDFRTLNRCLDDAIAGAVTEHARDQAVPPDRGSQELRNLADTALATFEALQRGNVGVVGSTGALLRRCLIAMRALAERPFAEVAYPKLDDDALGQFLMPPHEHGRTR